MERVRRAAILGHFLHKRLQLHMDVAQGLYLASPRLELPEIDYMGGLVGGAAGGLYLFVQLAGHLADAGDPRVDI